MVTSTRLPILRGGPDTSIRGSLGCHTEPIARFAMLTCRKNRYKLKMYRIPYDDRALFEQFERRTVPERDFIYRAFLGGKGRGFTRPDLPS